MVLTKLWVTALALTGLWGIAMLAVAASDMSQAGPWVLGIGWGPFLLTLAAGYWARWLAK